MPKTDSSKLTVKFKRGGRIKESHGGYSYLHRAKADDNRKHILKYLIAARQGLVRDLADIEEDLTTAQIILIDRTISLLGCTRLMEEYAREHGIMRGNELQPCLQKNYITYNNTIRLNLQLLGIDNKDAERVLSPLEYIKQYDEKKAQESGEKTTTQNLSQDEKGAHRASESDILQGK